MSNRHRGTFLLLPLFGIGLAAAANAQTRVDCRAPQQPRFSAAAGISEMSLELPLSIVREEPNTSVGLKRGAQFAGRADFSVAGDLRFRLEASRTRFDVRRTTYDSAYAVTAERSIGSMTARHLVALLGKRMGRVPCSYVAAGGGIYALGFRNTSFRNAGVALTAGMELPTGGRSAIHLDTAVHMIGSGDTGARAVTSSSGILTANVLIGWAYRF